MERSSSIPGKMPANTTNGGQVFQRSSSVAALAGQSATVINDVYGSTISRTTGPNVVDSTFGILSKGQDMAPPVATQNRTKISQRIRMETQRYDVNDIALETTPLHLNMLDTRDEAEFVKNTNSFMSRYIHTDVNPRKWQNLALVNHCLQEAQLKELSSKGRLTSPDDSGIFHRDVLGSAERWGVSSRPFGIAGMGPDTTAGVKSKSKHMTLFMGGTHESDNTVSDNVLPQTGDKIFALLRPEQVTSKSNYVTHLRDGKAAIDPFATNILSLDQTQLTPGYVAVVYQWRYVFAGVVDDSRQSMGKSLLMDQVETKFRVRMKGMMEATPTPVTITEHYKVLFATVVDEYSTGAGRYTSRNMLHPEIPIHRNYALQKTERKPLRISLNSGCQGRDYVSGHSME